MFFFKIEFRTGMTWHRLHKNQDFDTHQCGSLLYSVFDGNDQPLESYDYCAVDDSYVDSPDNFIINSFSISNGSTMQFDNTTTDFLFLLSDGNEKK